MIAAKMNQAHARIASKRNSLGSITQHHKTVTRSRRSQRMDSVSPNTTPPNPAKRWLGTWFNLLDQTRRWQTSLEAMLAPHGISVNELFVLWQLCDIAAPGITQIDLARRLQLSPALMSGMMETMQRRGWIEAVRSPHDRRRLLCSLTALGRAQYADILLTLAPLEAPEPVVEIAVSLNHWQEDAA